MRVGSLVYATAQGLGYLAKGFYDHGIVTDVMVIAHGKHEEQPWYPKAERITSLKDSRQQQKMREFCASMDVMLFFETPFDWNLLNYLEYCKKSVLMPMYECTPERLPAYPDLLLCPSKLDEKVFKEKYPAWDMTGRIEYLPVPVEYPWKLRTKAEVFVHNAGHGGLKGRNGTGELLLALMQVRSPTRIVIRSQEELRIDGCSVNLGKIARHLAEVGGSLTYRIGSVPYLDLFSQGDVFVFPETHNGLSLPLQEARASGMLVMCGDRFPMNDWLPREPLIPVQGYVTNRIGPPYMPFEQAQFDPKVIAAKIDEWYGKDITDYSRSALNWAESISWKVLGPKYRELLEKVVSS